jgi:hypothetical protein
MALKRSQITIGLGKKYIQISHISFGYLHSSHYIYMQTGKNNIINNKMKELHAFRKFLAEDRGEFGQESIDKLRDTIEAMGDSEAHEKALDLVDDGAFFPEEGTYPATNQTQNYVEDFNTIKNDTDNYDEEDVEEAKLFLDAIIIIKNAVKKTGPISYGEMGQSYNYYVKGDDLFTQSRETFEVPNT